MKKKEIKEALKNEPVSCEVICKCGHFTHTCFHKIYHRDGSYNLITGRFNKGHFDKCGYCMEKEWKQKQ